MTTKLEQALAKATEEGYDTLLPEIFEAARQHLADAPHIEAILEARKAATEGEWEINGNTINYDEKRGGALAVVIYAEDMKFITKSANAATALIKNREGENK